MHCLARCVTFGVNGGSSRAGSQIYLACLIYSHLASSLDVERDCFTTDVICGSLPVYMYSMF